MGTADRIAREKEELKALILDAARKLFVKKGIEQTTIRNIADSIDYSVGTVYVYYKDKNSILNDLHSQGFAQLISNMSVLANVSEPMERLKALGRLYMKFALENPDMYDLMFIMKAPIEFLKDREQEQWNEGKATFDFLTGTVTQCMEAGYFKGHSVLPVSFLIWSVVHGMSSLYIRERIKGCSIENSDYIMEEGYVSFLRMIDKI